MKTHAFLNQKNITWTVLGYITGWHKKCSHFYTVSRTDLNQWAFLLELIHIFQMLTQKCRYYNYSGIIESVRFFIDQPNISLYKLRLNIIKYSGVSIYWIVVMKNCHYVAKNCKTDKCCCILGIEPYIQWHEFSYRNIVINSSHP